MSDVNITRNKTRIPRGQTAILDRVEGNLEVGHNATIQACGGKNVVVTGDVYLEGKAYVKGDLECNSVVSGVFFSRTGEFTAGPQRARVELTGRYVGKLEVNGNLTAHKQLNVTHSVEVTGTISAENIDVGGKIEANDIKCYRIRVGGRAGIINTFEAQSVDVGGKVDAHGKVKIGDLNVGGEAEVGGGSITGNIHVGGRFISTKPLQFGELLIYGKGSLAADCKGVKISTFGKLDVCGNIACDTIQAGGSIDIHGDCHSKHVELGGKLEVRGSLFVSDKFEGYGSAEVEHNFEGRSLRVNGKFKANEIIVEEEADVSGKVEAKQGLKAKQVTVRTGSRCEGVIVAEHVEVGKSADLSYGGWANFMAGWAAAGAMVRVDDVYANEVVLGPMSQAARIFAAKASLERCSTVWQVSYTDELKIAEGAGVSEPPRKVDSLPKPPL